jgi:hypothetical protein
MRQNASPRHEPKVALSFFSYSITFAALAGGGTDSQSFNVEADADFRLQMLTQFSTIAAGLQTDATRVLPIMTILITDTGSGRNFMDFAQPVNNLFGTAEDPFVLPRPKIFPARSTVLVEATNLTGATTYTTVLTFIGSKIYKLG